MGMAANPNGLWRRNYGCWTFDEGTLSRFGLLFVLSLRMLGPRRLGYRRSGVVYPRTGSWANCWPGELGQQKE